MRNFLDIKNNEIMFSSLATILVCGLSNAIVYGLSIKE
jgi:hypothetical protein